MRRMGSGEDCSFEVAMTPGAEGGGAACRAGTGLSDAGLPGPCPEACPHQREAARPAASAREREGGVDSMAGLLSGREGGPEMFDAQCTAVGTRRRGQVTR